MKRYLSYNSGHLLFGALMFIISAAVYAQESDNSAYHPQYPDSGLTGFSIANMIQINPIQGYNC